MLKHAFVKGLKEKYTEQGVEAKIEQLDICKMQIGSCKGCFVCWKVTPGQLFSVKELSSRTGAHLQSVEQAGREYASGTISDETKAGLKELLFPKEAFEQMAALYNKKVMTERTEC